MDRRQRKTRAAIFQAFNKLLEEKHFNNITVQEILDEANVGRSTFYSHFETKDALLKEMCTDIFDHIFSHELHSETSHDFSSSDNVLGVLSGESSELFMRYFKEYLVTMFEQYPDSIRQDVPKEFALNHLVGSLADDVRWWIGTKMEMPPEELAECYLKLIGFRD